MAIVAKHEHEPRTKERRGNISIYYDTLASEYDSVRSLVGWWIIRYHLQGALSHYDISSELDDIVSEGITMLTSKLRHKKRASISKKAVVRIEAKRASKRALARHYSRHKKEHTSEQVQWIEASEQASKKASEQASEQARALLIKLISELDKLERHTIGTALAMDTIRASKLASELGCSDRTIKRRLFSIRQKAKEIAR